MHVFDLNIFTGESNSANGTAEVVADQNGETSAALGNSPPGHPNGQA